MQGTEGGCSMNSQGIKAKLMAVSLFVTSVGGTFAIFGFVPMLAHRISPNPPVAPTQFQAFPEVNRTPASSQSFTSSTSSPFYRSKQARAVDAN